MNISRRTRQAADVALGYAADERGHGVAFAAVSTGSAAAVVRLPFKVRPMPALEGLEQGYAAIAAVASHLKARGVSRARIRVADERVAADLNGAGAPPKSLAMLYVSARCTLRTIGPVRLETAQSTEIRDLGARAQAEVGLHAAA
jgi:hypothetical protein